MVLVAAVLLTAGTLLFTLLVRTKDIPQAEPVSPVQHLEDRKAQIYENLRDLQFEYRVGKLSDEDYQRTKQELQAQLAVVLGDIDKVKQSEGMQAVGSKANPPTAKKTRRRKVSADRSAKIEESLKFFDQ